MAASGTLAITLSNQMSSHFNGSDWIRQAVENMHQILVLKAMETRNKENESLLYFLCDADEMKADCEMLLVAEKEQVASKQHVNVIELPKQDS